MWLWHAFTQTADTRFLEIKYTSQDDLVMQFRLGTKATSGLSQVFFTVPQPGRCPNTETLGDETPPPSLEPDPPASASPASPGARKELNNPGLSVLVCF